MKQKNYLLKLWMLLLCVVAGVGSAVAEDKTITLDYNSFGLTTSYSEKTATVDGFSFTVNQGYKGSGNTIQMNSTKGSGILYNTTAITGLKSITVNVYSGSKTYTITTGTSEKPTANSQTGSSTGTYNAATGDTYFQLKVSGASYFSSIVITYDDSGSGGGSELTASDLALTGTPVALSFDLYNNSSAQTVSYTTSSTGAVTVSESEYVSCVVDETAKTITVTPTAVTPSDQTITVSQAADASYEAGSVTFTVSITDSTPIPTHMVTWIVNGNSTEQPYEEGALITFPENPADIDGKVFMGWTTEEINGTTDEAPEFVTSETMGESDKTYYAVFAEKTPGTQTTKTDVLTSATTGVTGTNSYSDWSGKTVNSDAVYAGNSAVSTNTSAIQLRSNNSNSGIISTTSGGTLESVTVTWDNGNTAGRSLDIYGSNTAYSKASDLYDSKKQGTKLGSITYNTSTSLTVSGNYSFIGLRSNNGALYLTDVSIEWTTGTPDTYSGYCTTVVADTREEAGISFAEATVSKDITENYTGQELTNPNNVSPITWSSSNEDVATVENGVVTKKDVGETTITAAFAGNESYKPATVSYTLTINAHIPVLSSIALSGEYPQTFFVGDEFSHEGMTVTVTYDDNSTQDVTSSARFSGYDMSTPGEQTVTVSYTEGDITKTATYTITVNELPKYTVTFSDGGSVTQASAGEAVTLPTRDAIGEYSFAGWSEANVSEETTTVPTIIPAGSYTPTADITLYPVYTRTEGGGGTTNKTADVTIADYATANNWSSGERYTSITMDENITATGKDNGNNSKYYSTSPGTWRHYAGDSGEITITTTSGTLESVTFTYTGNKLTFDGADVTSGTAVDVSGTSAVFCVSGSSSNTQVSAISVSYTISGGGTTYYWSAPVAAAVERPVITLADNPFYFSTTATITCATEGATIKYSFDGENWSDYTSALTITETKTIYAKAVKGNDESAITSVTATKNLAEPTVTIDDTGILNTNVFEGIDAGSLSASVKYNETTIDDASVTWSGNNDAVATINASTGAVTLVAAGSVTFTATYAGDGDYSEKSATYEMTVTNTDPNANDGSAEKPYTVAEAIAYINTLGSSTSTNDVYVSGIISQVDSYNSTYHSITYWISDDGTTTNQLEVYSGKGLNEADFSSKDDLQVGDIVTVKGKVKMYSSTPEFDKNNYLVSLQHKPVITAEDVDIEYNDTGDGIIYNIANYVNGTMTTSTEADWIYGLNSTDDHFDTEHNEGIAYFSVTENTSSESRSATITLTFTYGDNKTVTKDVTVTQAGYDPTPSIVFDGIETYSYETSFLAGNTNVHFVAKNINTEELTLVLCDADGNEANYDWFRGDIYADYYAKLYWDANTDTENARTAYFKVKAGNTESPIFAVTQAKFVADYATLPFEFDNGKNAISTTSGLTQNDLGTDYNSSPKLKFDGTGDYLILKINERPGTLTFDIKGNTFSGGTFKVQTSEDGRTYTDLKTYTELGETQNESFDNLGENVRYIKWIYTEKVNGNVALGKIVLAKPDNSPRLSVEPAEAEPFTYEEGGDLCDEQTFTVTGTNLTTEEITVSVTGEFELRPSTSGYANISTLTISNGEEFGVNMKENLSEGTYRGTLTIASEGATSITISLTGTVTAPVPPAITVAQTTVSVGAAGGEGTIDVTYTKINTDAVDLEFYESDGTTSATYDWIDAEIDQNNNLYYLVSENTGETRTAYLKVYGVDNNGGDDFIYSELITISQAAASSGDQFALFNGELVEGDYIIYYDGYAMKNNVDNSSRLTYEEVTPDNNIITTDNASIVWHIAPSGEYWTIYNADADAYAAGTGAKNKAQMINDGTDANALWTVIGTDTYDFVNKANNAANVNSYLRNNGTYGFACYAEGTGGALSLYKRASATITLATSGYASYCCDKALDFSTNSKNDFRAWYVSDVTGTTVTFSEITGKVKAGEGIILYGTPGAKCSLPYAKNGEELTGNMLRGTLEPTEVTTEMVIDGQSYTLFGLSNGQFVKMKNGTVKANKAFLPILTSQVPTGSNARLDIVFSEETDGIKSIESGKLTIDNSVYDLQGRRVETMKKGSLYIVNGKKFVSK